MVHSRSILPIIAIALSATVVSTIPAQAAPTSVWDRVAACESTSNWAINTGNGFYGGVQFTHSTWIAYGGGAYASNANLASKGVQIMIAERVLAAQGPGAWPVCGSRAGLTRGSGTGSVSRSRVRRPIVSGKLAVDGVLGPLTRGSMNRHGIYWNTRPAIMAWQARLRVAKDGVAGPATVSAMQRYLNTH